MLDVLHAIDIIAVCGGLVCVGLCLKTYRECSLGLPHPPGPPGFPLIGNLLDMPERDDWEEAQKWGKKYGDLIYIKNFGTPFLFVNSAEAAYELFTKRGYNYSSRPDMTMVNLSGWGWLLGIMPYGEEHRKVRLRVHRYFKSDVVKAYYDLHVQASRQLLVRLYRNPEGFLQYTRQCAGEQIMKIAYGYEARENDDPLIELAEKGLSCLGESQRLYLVNVLPFLQYLPKWFPGAGFKSFAEHSYKTSYEMLNIPYAEVKRQVLKGTAAPSMAKELIEEHLAHNGSKEDEEIIKKALGIVYVAGADTTVSVMQTFFLAMLLYPDTQRRGQEELDRVIGSSSLPTFDDRPNLPYVNAIVNEALRWQAVTPLGILRTVTEDDVYNGYHIPAGTVVCPNVWAMLRNPDEYKRPEEFNPDRWLQDNPPTVANEFAFGFGRRICPGRYFAENSIFIAIASILAIFDIERPHDEQGNVITPKGDYTPGHVRHPMPFECRVAIRPNRLEVLAMIVDPPGSRQ